jgi:hypothetical protein
VPELVQDDAIDAGLPEPGVTVARSILTAYTP